MERNVTEDTCRAAFQEAERQFSILYWAEIKDLAKDVLDENPDDEDAQDEALWERVDGHHWVIDTQWHNRILSATDNEDAWKEYGELDAGKASLQMAFSALLADAREALYELRNEQEATE